MRIFIKTLGCPKNEADSETLSEALRKLGHTVTEDESSASCVVVNTCGFIRPAVEESLDTVMEYGRRRSVRKVFVTGCLLGRYGDDLRTALAEADGFFPIDNPAELSRLVPASSLRTTKATARVRTAVPWGYVKVAEGCDRTCSFCVIPAIRGPFRSMPAERIVRSVTEKVSAGVSEIILVAQDLTSWGRSGGKDLVSLLRRLVRIRGSFCIRLLYLHPSSVTTTLCDLMLGEEKVLDYFDLPVQHSVPRILALMKRPVHGGLDTLRLLERIRKRSALAAVRTTLMTGFPGETRTDARALVRFVNDAGFNHLGCFEYSAEEGSGAAALGDPVPVSEKSRRRAAVMTAQAAVSAGWLAKFIGREFDAVADGPVDGTRTAFRNWYFAPEVDGRIVVHGRWKPGDRLRVRITRSSAYDLQGVPA